MISFLTVCEKGNPFLNLLIESIKTHVPDKLEYEHIIYMYDLDPILSESKIINRDQTKIFSGLNIGFGSAINYLSRRSKYQILYLINPDAIIEKFNLNEILSTLTPDSILSVEQLISKKSSYWGNLQIDIPISDLIDEYRFNGLSCDLFFNSHSASKNVLYADGAGLIIFKSTLINLGGFDEDFFLFGEDLELCIRLKSIGGIVKTIKNNSIVHFSGGSIMGGAANSNEHKTSVFRRNFTEYNSLQIALKHLEWYYLIPWIFLWILYVSTLTILGLLLLKTRYLTFYYKALFSALFNFKKIYKRRKIITKSKTQNSIYLLNYIRWTPSILVILFKVGFPKLD